MKTKWYKIVVWVSVAVVGLFFLFAVWYKYEYSMEPAAPYSMNFPELGTKLLIATQGSDFKNSITQGVADYYKSDSVYIKVIDVSALNEIDPDDYDAILVIHTWEYEKPPAAVSSFIEKTKSHKDKIVVMTTSGPGTSKMENVDAITGESNLQDVPVFVEKIIDRLDPLLATEN